MSFKLRGITIAAVIATIAGAIVFLATQRAPSPSASAPSGGAAVDPVDRLRERQREHKKEIEDEVAVLRGKLSSSPEEVGVALELSRALIELARSSPDRAPMKEAEEVLGRWLSEEKPP